MDKHLKFYEFNLVFWEKTVLVFQRRRRIPRTVSSARVRLSSGIGFKGVKVTFDFFKFLANLKYKRVAL